MLKLKQSLLAVIIGLALAAGISYAASWVGPTANPPLNNTDAPVNVGGTTQYKTGALGIGGWFAADSGLSWGKSSFLNLDQGGSIELGDGKTKGATPYIDFHYGIGSSQSQDYNARLINNLDGELSLNFDRQDGYGSFVVNNGRIGINTNNPQAKLDVAGNIKIADGTQGAGKVLTSDSDGNASWQNGQGGGNLSSSYVGSCGVNIYKPTCTCGQGEKIMLLERNYSGDCSVVYQNSSNVHGQFDGGLKGNSCAFSCFK